MPSLASWFGTFTKPASSRFLPLLPNVVSATVITVAVIAGTVILAVDGALDGAAAAGILGAAIPTAALTSRRSSGGN